MAEPPHPRANLATLLVATKRMLAESAETVLNCSVSKHAVILLFHAEAVIDGANVGAGYLFESDEHTVL